MNAKLATTPSQLADNPSTYLPPICGVRVIRLKHLSGFPPSFFSVDVPYDYLSKSFVSQSLKSGAGHVRHLTDRL